MSYYNSSLSRSKTRYGSSSRDKSTSSNDNRWSCSNNLCIADLQQGGAAKKGAIYKSLAECHQECELSDYESKSKTSKIKQQLEHKQEIIDDENEIPVKVIATVLFTDIRGSSALWKNYPEQMYAALIEHEKRMQEYVEDFEGVIVKTIGDAYMILFVTHEQEQLIFSGNSCNKSTRKLARKRASKARNSTTTRDNIDTLRRAIEFAITVQDDLQHDPIQVGNKQSKNKEVNTIQLRIGIGYGALFIRSNKIQKNISVIDVFVFRA